MKKIRATADPARPVDWLADQEAFLAAHGRSQAIGRTWLASEPCRMLARRFDAVPPGDDDAAVEIASTLLADPGLVGALLAPLIASLRDEARFEPPFRVHRDPLRVGAVLFKHPAVSISAGVLFADALAESQPARTVVMTGRRSVVRYHRADGTRLARWSLAGETCRGLAPLDVRDGQLLQWDGRCEANLVVAACRDVATVTATIRYGAAPVMREFAIADGSPVRTATLDDAVSRTAQLLTLLRLSGRADAGEAFEAASRHGEHHLRWTAMREWLALDVHAALPRLEVMAGDDPTPEVRAAATATLAMIRERIAACPA